MNVSFAGQPIKSSDFFDFEYAKSLWLDVKERAPMKERYDCHKNDGGAFDEWQKQFLQSETVAIKALETHPNADEIKRCYDTHLVYQVWKNIYASSRWAFGVEPWNQQTKVCGLIELGNIFTGLCNDLPDWRHPEDVKTDDAAIHKSNARSLKK